MDISNINGANAYTANKPASQPIENSPLRNEPKQALETNLNQEAAPAPQAFEVNITQEAQDRLAAEATPPPVKTEPDQNIRADQAPKPDQNPVATQEARQIVNIIA